MLTGDKLETAENIARSCNLIHRNFEVFRISEKTHEEIDKNLKSILASFPSLLQKNVSKAILVEGEALSNQLQRDKNLFIFSCDSCNLRECRFEERIL